MLKLEFKSLGRRVDDRQQEYLEVVYSDYEDGTEISIDLEIEEVRRILKIDNPDQLPAEKIKILDNLTEYLQTKQLGLEEIIYRRDVDNRTRPVVLEIHSDILQIYHLPWQKTFKSLIVHNIIRGGPSIKSTKNRNILFLVSSAYKDPMRLDCGYKNLHKDYIKESQNIAKIMMDEGIKQVDRPQLFTILRHLHYKSLRDVDLTNYSHIHLVSHGDDCGKILLEDPGDYKVIQPTSPENFIEIIEGGSFNLVFLSCCYSGSGNLEKKNLPQMLIEKKIARNVIAFQDEIGSPTAIEFSRDFYDKYRSTIECTAKSAFNFAFKKQLSNGREEYRGIPVFYESI